jgi:hypothetical protein
MEQLKAAITAGNIAYDAIVAKVEVLERTKEQQKASKYKNTTKTSRLQSIWLVFTKCGRSSSSRCVWILGRDYA